MEHAEFLQHPSSYILGSSPHSSRLRVRGRQDNRAQRHGDSGLMMHRFTARSFRGTSRRAFFALTPDHCLDQMIDALLFRSIHFMEAVLGFALGAFTHTNRQGTA